MYRKLWDRNLEWDLCVLHTASTQFVLIRAQQTGSEAGYTLDGLPPNHNEQF